MSLPRVLLLTFVLIGFACAVYFDAGSSGIKVVLTDGDNPTTFQKGQSVKALATYETEAGVVYRGLAAVAMAYRLGCQTTNPSLKTACQKVKYQYMEQDSRESKPPSPTPGVMSPSIFVEEAFKFLANVNGTTPVRVPILATAGMRPPEVPQDVFTSDDKDVGICIQAKSPRTPKTWKIAGKTRQFDYATDDKQCRVISGTEEALLEFTGQDKIVSDMRGTATMGGASAQIAIPLVGTKQVNAWKDLIKSTILANSEPEYKTTSPLWFPGSHPRPLKAEDEYKNFIDIREGSQVRGWGKGVLAKATKDVDAVGLLSFLAIANRDANKDIGKRNVFGGSDAIEAILESKHFAEVGGKGCKTFSQCHAAVVKAFYQDPLFRHIVPTFRTHFSSVPVLLAGGMDIGRTIDGKNTDAVKACTTLTGIFGAKELEACLKATFALLETSCNTPTQLRAVNTATGWNCKAALARFVVTDALWGNNPARIGKLGHKKDGTFLETPVDVKFSTKAWTGDDKKNGGADPAAGFANIGTFTKLAQVYGLKKRNMNVNRRQRNRRHH